jgi:hypothetical protein
MRAVVLPSWATGLGQWRAGLAGPSPYGLRWAEPKKIKNKKQKTKKTKMCVCINKKINMNLLFLFIDARVRIKVLIQIYFIVFYLIT